MKETFSGEGIAPEEMSFSVSAAGTFTILGRPFRAPRSLGDEVPRAVPAATMASGLWPVTPRAFCGRGPLRGWLRPAAGMTRRRWRPPVRLGRAVAPLWACKKVRCAPRERIVKNLPDGGQGRGCDFLVHDDLAQLCPPGSALNPRQRDIPRKLRVETTVHLRAAEVPDAQASDPAPLPLCRHGWRVPRCASLLRAAPLDCLAH